MAKLRALWPPPTYVAKYEDGKTHRMSFFSRDGEPISIEQARQQAERHRPIKEFPDDPCYALGIPTGKFIRLVRVHIEHKGRRVKPA